jgi:hypothetical protein
VLRAYQQCCAICRLRHDELLEAAHILPDIHPFGEPVVPNGLALCKLHHAAFDANIIGVTPDLDVTVRLDVLQEIDDAPAWPAEFPGPAQSTCRAPTTSSPIATSWPSATPSSAARAERLYPRVDCIPSGTLTRKTLAA